MKKADGTLKDPLETSPPPLAHGLACGLRKWASSNNVNGHLHRAKTGRSVKLAIAFWLQVASLLGPVLV